MSLQALARGTPAGSVISTCISTSLASQSSTALYQQQIRSMRSILKPPPKSTYYSKLDVAPPEALSSAAALKRREHTTPHRTGLLARKIGMAQTFDAATGHEIPCTVLQVDRCQVVGHKRLEQHGYWAVQVGCGWKSTMRTTNAELGEASARGVSVKEHICEFAVRDASGLVDVGNELHPSWFKVGQLVDARGITKGKGFAGGMKRHGWSGQPASHGQSLTHRTMGSAGPSQGGGSRVHPGKNMPGRMGGEYHTIQHLKVMKVDDENGIIMVKGCLSGAKRSIIELYDSKKRPEQVAKLELPTIPLPPTYELDTAKGESVAAA